MEVRRRRSEKKPSLKQLETYWTPQPLFFKISHSALTLSLRRPLKKYEVLTAQGQKTAQVASKALL